MPIPFSIDDTLAVLARTPATLRALLQGLPERWVRNNEGPDTFSPFDVVGHLIDGEETDWMARARIIRAQGENRTFTPYDRFRHKDRNKGKVLDALLDEFARLRQENLATVRGWRLAPVDLDLVGQHPAFGPVTLRQLLATWAVHDLGHIAQVSRVLAKQYGDEVGPWKAYLPVLSDRVPT
ncbi:MAG TPA: DinB family protein [Gemmatimonadales bacterium]|nr:DinB family protein [Gemmatimonadales bacterium]